MAEDDRSALIHLPTEKIVHLYKELLINHGVVPISGAADQTLEQLKDVNAELLKPGMWQAASFIGTCLLAPIDAVKDALWHIEMRGAISSN